MFITTNLRNVLSSALLLLINIQIASATCDYTQTISGEELSVGIILHWSTNLEKENAMFIVERSDDGIQFLNIGAVKGAGYSTTHTEYSFLDKTLPTGQCYYRLRQIDYSGVFSTSSVFVFNKFKPEHFTISNMSPFLSPDHMEIQFDSFQNGQLEFILTDWKGKILLTDNIDAMEGFNTLNINMSAYNDMVYQLTLKSAKQEQTITFRKQQTMSDISMKN